MIMCKHAKDRQQQRCIPPLIIEWLLQYGDERHDSHGCLIRFFSKSGKKCLAKDVGKTVVGLLGRYMNSYLIEDLDGTVVTVGKRYKHIHL